MINPTNGAIKANICESFNGPTRNIGTLDRGDLERRMSTYEKMLNFFLDCSMLHISLAQLNPTSDNLTRNKLSQILTLCGI